MQTKKTIAKANKIKNETAPITDLSGVVVDVIAAAQTELQKTLAGALQGYARENPGLGIKSFTDWARGRELLADLTGEKPPQKMDVEGQVILVVKQWGEEKPQ